LKECVILVAISVQELRRLIVHLRSRQPPDLDFHWNWSIWRRHHQTQAKRAHYRRRTYQLQL
jgi:hypothetical protein